MAASLILVNKFKYSRVIFTFERTLRDRILSSALLPEEKYDIFISYNKADVEFAERLVKRIELEPHKGRHLRCFFASWDVAPGENILLKIEDALTNSRLIALIMSPDWGKSDWTTLERAIPVYQDPAGLKGRIIPILRRNCEIPPSIRILNWLDFRTDRNFEREIRKLLARLKGEPYRTLLKTEKKEALAKTLSYQSFDSVEPEMQKELIVSNLFQILEMPIFLNRARAKVKKRSDVWSMLGEGVSLPVFAIREEKQEIYSFAPLDNPQQKINTLIQEPSTDKISVSDILNSEQYRLLIEILNRAMTAHMKGIGMVYDWKNKKTFFPLEKDNDDSRYGSWNVGGREYYRFVVRKSKSGRYYIHRSCKATFTRIGSYLFLKIIPGWHFTSDGIFRAVPPNMMTSLSSRWMNIQRNHSVLDDVRFWVYKLSKGKEIIELDVGADTSIIILKVPFSSTMNRGIEEDYRERLWLEEEPIPDDSEKVLEEEDLEAIEEELDLEEDEYE